MTALEATQKCLEHYRRMLAFMETLELGDPVSGSLILLMLMEIGETWGDHHCALCKKYHSGHPPTIVISNIGCPECPLKKIGYGCNETGAPWRRVDTAITVSDWITAVKGYMIPALCSAEYYVRQRPEEFDK